MEELNYKEAIEELQNDPKYEAKGDALYIDHEDEAARLEWAFYRPSGSHPRQIQDESHIVAIMAFNHSRLGALERFNLISEEIINNDKLRHKIRNRSRMLFRAMIDDDFNDLVQVLQKYPVFFDLAYDQMINGRIWNEIYADPFKASEFLELYPHEIDENFIKGITRRLQPVSDFNIDESKHYLESLNVQVQNLHKVVKEHYAKEFQKWLDKKTFHPLQKILWEKNINILYEG